MFIRATKRSGLLQGKGKYWFGLEDRPRGLPLCSQVREICRTAMCINKRKACVTGGKKKKEFHAAKYNKYGWIGVLYMR